MSGENWTNLKIPNLGVILACKAVFKQEKIILFV